MFNTAERLLAWRYMRSKRREGFVSLITLFSIIGITLGVATLILVTSLMNGIREEMLDNFIGFGGHISIYSQEKALTDVNALVKDIENIEGVTSVIDRIEGQVMASSGHRSGGAQVMGFFPDDLMNNSRIMEHISGGTVDLFSVDPGVMIGKRLMENLGLKEGDSITLISPQGRQTVVGLMPRIKNYPIMASFELGMHAIDSSLIIMPFKDAKTYFMLPEHPNGSATALQILVEDMEDAPELADKIRHVYASQGLRVYDWKQSHAGVLTALRVQRDVMFIILALIILVATFNIISSLIMLVQDKAKEIAILRTMGASRATVMRIFLMSGMAVGITGTIIGLGLGLLAAAYIETLRIWIENIVGQEILVGNIYFLSSLPTKTDPIEVIAIVILSLGLSLIATLYPAWRASNYHPAEAIHHG